MDRIAADQSKDLPSHRVMTWADRLYQERDRWLADPNVQKLLAKFPLTRPFAQREARAVFDVCAGFVYTQVLLACVRLKLLESLQNWPKTLDEICLAFELERDAALKLLKAAAALGLVGQRSGGRYGLGARGAAILGNPGIAAMVEHHALLYADLQDPLALLRGRSCPTQLSTYWSYAGGRDVGRLDASSAATYSGLMTDSQALVAEEVLDAYSLTSCRCLLDVGGGEGRFLSTVAKRYPDLSLMMFDLPPVAERARARFKAQGLESRVAVTGGSFFADALPEGADTVSLVRICFDHPDASVVALLRAIRKVLPANGAVLVAEPISGDSALAAVNDAYYGFYLLSMGGGMTRTPEQFLEIARAAGFSQVRKIATRRPLFTGLLEIRA